MSERNRGMLVGAGVVVLVGVAAIMAIQIGGESGNVTFTERPSAQIEPGPNPFGKSDPLDEDDVREAVRDELYLRDIGKRTR